MTWPPVPPPAMRKEAGARGRGPGEGGSLRSRFIFSWLRHLEAYRVGGEVLALAEAPSDTQDVQYIAAWRLSPVAFPPPPTKLVRLQHAANTLSSSRGCGLRRYSMAPKPPRALSGSSDRTIRPSEKRRRRDTRPRRYPSHDATRSNPENSLPCSSKKRAHSAPPFPTPYSLSPTPFPLIPHARSRSSTFPTTPTCSTTNSPHNSPAATEFLSSASSPKPRSC